MKVQQDETGERIVSVASSIDRDRESWRNWAALHMQVTDCNHNDFRAATEAVQMIVRSYLNGIEGTVYFCNAKDIYMLCRDVSADILEQAVVQIRDLIFSDHALSCVYNIYDLGEDSTVFSENVFNGIGDQFSIHVTNGIEPGSIKITSSTVPPKILMVEDDEITRRMVENALQNECVLASADTANKAFALYAAEHPDIVLLDIGLPDNNGNAVLEWIMRNDPGACVIMMSSRCDVDHMTDCMETGAKGFISKPFVKDDLMHYIRKHA